MYKRLTLLLHDLFEMNDMKVAMYDAEKYTIKIDRINNNRFNIYIELKKGFDYGKETV